MSSIRREVTKAKDLLHYEIGAICLDLCVAGEDHNRCVIPPMADTILHLLRRMRYGINGWEKYIDWIQETAEADHTKSCAIVGLESKQFWAYGGTLIPYPNEMSALIDVIREPNKALYPNVMHPRIGGRRFVLLDIMEQPLDMAFISFKRRDNETNDERYSAVAVKSGSCAILGICKGTNVGDRARLRMRLHEVREYLESNGF